MVVTSTPAKKKVAAIVASTPQPIGTPQLPGGAPITPGQPAAQPVQPSTMTATTNKPPTPLDTFQTNLNSVDSNIATAYDDYKKTIADINSGAVPLSPTEQNLLTSLQQSFDRQKVAQETANKSYEGVVSMSGARDGLSRYSPIQFQQQVSQAVSQGAQKIQDIDQRAALKINEVRESIFDKKYKQAKDAYDEYVGLLKDKRTTIKDIYDRVYQSEKDLRDYNIQVERLRIEQAKLPYELKKLQMEINTARNKALNATGFSDAQLKQIDSSTETKKLIAIKDLNNKLNAYREVAAQPGKFDIVGSRKAIADSLYADLKIAYKEAANLGALTGPDVSIIGEAIKPTSGGIGALLGYKTGGGQKGTLASIDTALTTLGKQQKTYSDLLTSKWGSSDPYIQNLISTDKIDLTPAPKSLTDYYNSHPDQQTKIDSLITENPNLSQDDILDLLINP